MKNHTTDAGHRGSMVDHHATETRLLHHEDHKNGTKNDVEHNGGGGGGDGEDAKPRDADLHIDANAHAHGNAHTNANAHGHDNANAKRHDAKHSRRMHRYLMQRRILIGVTGWTVFGILIWIVCVATDYWLVYTFQEPHLDHNQNQIQSYTFGLWKSCIHTVKQTSDCRWHLFLSGDSDSYDFYYGNMSMHEYDNTLTVRRSEIAFALVTLVLMVIGNIFAVYSIRHVRYTYKRLTAGVHILTGVCAVVCLEIVIRIPKTVKTTTTIKVDTSAKMTSHSHYPTYGYSLILGWIVFSSYIIAGFFFLIFSKKLKGRYAPNAEVKEANEPFQVTRPH